MREVHKTKLLRMQNRYDGKARQDMISRHMPMNEREVWKDSCRDLFCTSQAVMAAMRERESELMI